MSRLRAMHSQAQCWLADLSWVGSSGLSLLHACLTAAGVKAMLPEDRSQESTRLHQQHTDSWGRCDF